MCRASSVFRETLQASLRRAQRTRRPCCSSTLRASCYWFILNYSTQNTLRPAPLASRADSDPASPVYPPRAALSARARHCICGRQTVTRGMAERGCGRGVGRRRRCRRGSFKLCSAINVCQMSATSIFRETLGLLAPPRVEEQTRRAVLVERPRRCLPQPRTCSSRSASASTARLIPDRRGLGPGSGVLPAHCSRPTALTQPTH